MKKLSKIAIKYLCKINRHFTFLLSVFYQRVTNTAYAFKKARVLSLLLLCSLPTMAQDTLYIDNFDTKTGTWREFVGEEYRHYYDNGHFVYECYADGAGFSLKNPFDIDPKSNFEIETTFTIEEQNDNSAYGLVWGASQTDEYAMLVNKAGDFCVNQWQNNEMKSLIGWKKHQILVGESITLTIKKVNSVLTVYINHWFVGRIAFEDFMGEMVGFYIENKTKIGIKKLQITTLPARSASKLTLENIQLQTANNDTILDSNETGTVKLRIRNNSTETANDVELKIIGDSIGDITYPPSRILQTIPALTTLEVNCEISGSRYLLGRERTIGIQCSDIGTIALPDSLRIKTKAGKVPTSNATDDSKVTAGTVLAWIVGIPILIILAILNADEQ